MRMPEPELALALVGFGNVGRALVELLDQIEERLEFEWRLVAIATQAHGSVVDAAGIDARHALATYRAAGTLDALDRTPHPRSGIDVIRQVTNALEEEASEGRLVVVETTVLDIDGGEPATAHVHASLEGLAHVVTANKGPTAFAFQSLDRLARSVDRAFLFEGAVMDGIPVFNLVRDTMPAVRIDGFRGVINTTCQFALSAMERGADFDEAVREMQERGIAEADPSLDVEGWDAAAKTAALVNVLMGGGITPHDVTRVGVRAVSPADIVDAARRGRRIRLVASATRRAGRLSARVEPELLDRDDPLASLGSLENALYLGTDLLGEVGIVQRGSSLQQTAYAVLSDLSAIARRLRRD
jgi:homoserine dehydrogenase